MEKIYIGEINGYNYWLGDIVFKGLDWYQAKDVCEALGDGWELPSKEVMKLAWENPYTRNILKSEEGWYWTGSEYSAAYVCAQFSYTGLQFTNYNKTNSSFNLVSPVYKEKVVERPTFPEHKVFYTRKKNTDGSICNLSGITYVFSKNEDGTYNLHASVCRGDNFSKAVGRDVAINSSPLFRNLSISEGGWFLGILDDLGLYVGTHSERSYRKIEKRALNLKRIEALPNNRRIKEEMEECREGLVKAFEDYSTYINSFGFPKYVGEYTLRINKKELGLLLGLVGSINYNDTKSGGLLYDKLKSLDRLLTHKIMMASPHLPMTFTGDLEDVVDKILKG